MSLIFLTGKNSFFSFKRPKSLSTYSNLKLKPIPMEIINDFNSEFEDKKIMTPTSRRRDYSSINTSTLDDHEISPKYSIFTTLRQFPTLFWILLGHISLTSPILYTFTAFGTLYFEESFHVTSTEDAGEAVSLLYSSIMLAPLTGIVIDYVGYRSQVQLVASIQLPLIFLLLNYQVVTPKLSMIWMGFIYSITESNGLAMISRIVAPDLIGTAYGLLGCCISLALLIEPASVGYLFEFSNSFVSSIWIFILITTLGSIMSALVWMYDMRNDVIVSLSSRQ